jgi:hypothetical protein
VGSKHSGHDEHDWTEILHLETQQRRGDEGMKRINAIGRIAGGTRDRLESTFAATPKNTDKQTQSAEQPNQKYKNGNCNCVRGDVPMVKLNSKQAPSSPSSS